MAWFGNSLSQIGGQLSNFTKEVLTEGTQEVHDHVTEERVAKEKIVELECQISNLQFELSRERKTNEDLTEKVEASELQITSISKEYRSLLESKEVEMKDLKQRHNHLVEMHQKMLISQSETMRVDVTANSTLSSTTGFSSDEMDFGDVISSQHEINCLSDNVRRLTSEVDHWKHLAQDLATKSQGENEDKEIGESLKRIQQLEADVREVRQERDNEIIEHQHQLAALQDLHAQKLITIKKQHQTQLQQLEADHRSLQEELEEKNKQLLLKKTHNTQQLASEDDEVSEFRGHQRGHQLSRDDQQHESHEETLPLPNKSSQDREPDNESLTSSSFVEVSSIHNKQLENQVGTLQSQIERYENEIGSLETIRSDWKTEKEALENIVLQVRKQLDEREKSLRLTKSQKDHQLTKTFGFQSQRHNVDTRKKSLSKPKADEKKATPVLPFDVLELEFNEPSERDSIDLSENEALTFDLVDSEAEVSSNTDTDTEVDLDEWTRQIDELMQANADLENERDSLAVQKDDLDKEVEGLKGRIDEMTGRIDEMTVKNSSLESSLSQSDHHDLIVSDHEVDNEIEKMKQMLQEKDRMVSELESEKVSLVESLDELDSQHEVALEQVIQSRDHLDSNNKDLTEKHSHLVDKLDESFQRMEEMEKEKADLIENVEVEYRGRQSLLSEVDGLKVMLNERDCQLKDVTQERDHLSLEMSNLSVSFSEKLNQDGLTEKQVNEMREMLDQSDAEIRTLSTQREHCLSQISELNKKLENGAQALNGLHMDKREMEATISSLKSDITDLKDKQTDLKKEKIYLEKTGGSLQTRLQEVQQQLQVVEMLNQSQNNQIHDQLEGNIHQLKERLQVSTDICEKYQWEIDVVRKTVQDLEIKVEVLGSEKEAVTKVLETSEIEFSNQKDELNDKYKQYIDDLEMQVDVLKSEVSSLEKELAKGEQRFRDQTKHYEKYVEDMSSARDTCDDSTSQVERTKLVKASHDKDMEIEDLKDQIDDLKAELEDSKEMLQSAIDGQKPLTDLVQEKETELASLKNENETLLSQVEKNETQMAEQNDLLQGLKEKDKLLKLAREENRKLHAEVADLRHKLDSDTVDSKTLDIITDLESEITTLNQKFSNAQEDVHHFRKIVKEQDEELVQLNNNCDKKADTITDLGDKISSKDKQIVSLQDDIQGLQNDVQKLKLKVGEGNVNTTIGKGDILKPKHTSNSSQLNNETQHQQGGQPILGDQCTTSDIKQGGDADLGVHTGADAGHKLGEEALSTEDADIGQSDGDTRTKKLRQMLQDKDGIIEELQKNNSALLKMLENKSLAIHGNQTLVDLHKCQNRLKSLQVEREQIMSVLNEKSRECSSLKSEVHQLMNVVSAEKVAISKLQDENRNLNQERDSLATSAPPGGDDMSKEAIKNLSRMIRDRDQEIDALTQKNETLVMVLQDTQPSDGNSNGRKTNGIEIEALLQERHNLAKQLQAYVADREQIVVALNQKHQESVSYHGEVQRLMQSLHDNENKYQQLRTDYDKIVKQFEDKQQLLLKSQNDLANYKQRFVELESTYHQLKAQHGTKTEKHIHVGNKTLTLPLLKENNVELTLYKEKCDEVTSLNASVQQLTEKVQQVEQDLQDKDKLISELNRTTLKHETVIASKDTACSGLHKQIDRLHFRIQQLETDLQDATNDREKQRSKVTDQQSQNDMMKDSMNHLSLAIKDKDFELKALKEKTEMLMSLVEDHATAHNTPDLTRVLAESQSMQLQAETFQQERDQAILSLKQKTSQIDSLQNELQNNREKETKLQRELERLRTHLLQIEEGYTQEALDAEEREKELRNRLALTEEKIVHSDHAVLNASKQASNQVENLEVQLHALAVQRDQAIIQLSATRQQLQQYAANLQTLQLVLEQFQTEKAVEIEKTQEVIEHLKEENSSLKAQLSHIQNELDEASGGLEAAHRLHQQLDTKQQTITSLKDQVERDEIIVKDYEDKMRQLQTANEGKVDKMIIKSLFVGYFSTAVNKRSEVIRLIARVLDFNHQDLHKVGAESIPSSRPRLTSWLTIPNILRRSPAIAGATPKSPASPPPSTQSTFDKSFSELFVKFLETESTPKPKLKLPVDEMVREEKEKASHHQHHRDRDRPAFNPFSALRHPAGAGAVAIGIQNTSTNTSNMILNSDSHQMGDSHILMAGAMLPAPAMPMFTPVTPEGAPSTSTAGNILKDVLKS